MATLVYSDAGGSSARFQLSGAPILIGGAAECAIRSGNPLLDPKHARLFERDGAFWIEDLGSASGIFVGDKRVSETRLHYGEVVVVGSLLLRLDDSGNGAPLSASELVLMLAASTARQKQLEDERNALGARVGELHQELAAAQAQVEPTLPRAEPVPPAAAAVHDPNALEKLVAELRAAEKAKRDLEAKINSAQRKRAKTQSELNAAEAAEPDGDFSEMEIKQVQMLALNAQLAESGKRVERLRGQLQTRNKEIAELRVKAAKQGGPLPKTTQPYAVPAAPSDTAESEKLSELKSRFEAQFERAVTLQRKLKTAEAKLADAAGDKTRAAKLERDIAAQAKKHSELETKLRETSRELAKAKSESEKANRELEKTKAELSASQEVPTTDPSEIEKHKKKQADLRVLIEGAQRESGGLRSKLAEEKEKSKSAEARAEGLAKELADSAEQAVKQAEELVTLGARLEEKTAAVAQKDREITEMAASVAVNQEKLDEVDKLTKQIASLETDLQTVRGAQKKHEQAKDSALAARRELEARLVGADSKASELQAKLEHAERRLRDAQAARTSAEGKLEELGRELAVARDARLAAEEVLSTGGPKRENTAVISLKRRISENQEEAASEIDRLMDRLREVETDLDRALDAEQAALARVDAEAAAVSAKIDALEKKRDSIAAERDRIAADQSDLVTEREQFKLQRDEARRERDKAKVALAAAATDLEAKATRLKELQESVAKASEQTDTVESKAGSGEAGKQATKELRSRVVELASQNAQLSSELSASKEEADDVRERLAELEASLRNISGELEETTSARRAIEEAHEDLTRRYEAIGETSGANTGDMADLVKECQLLRDRVAELEAGLDLEKTEAGVRLETFSDDESEFTTPGSPAPALAESVGVLREAIADLRKQMRSASDEAAVMEGDSASLDVINGALSAAVERVEAAREALAQVAEIAGLSEPTR